MKTGEHIRTMLTVLVVVSLAAGQNPQAQSTSLAVGSAQIKGEVTLRSPQGSPLTAQRGLVLDPESIIETAKESILLVYSSHEIRHWLSNRTGLIENGGRSP
jgi:hypothetical protein